MFTIIGERINLTRKPIEEAVENKDAARIAREATRQEKAGATHVDVNAGGDPAREVENMQWLVTAVSEATELPLVFDSPNVDALRAGLALCNRPGSIVNSITAERERLESILPLVQEFNTGVICLTMSDLGMPEDVEGRLNVTRELVERLQAEGVEPSRLYFDHLVRPVSTNQEQARCLLEALRITKTEYPESHTALGLSNVSFGLPVRSNLNRAFLAMLVAAGCDGAIFDPCEPGMVDMLRSARAVMGLDDFCMEYIQAFRGR
jgi:5-methyltetrahydrofolate--homocysteine methyltransferase